MYYTEMKCVVLILQWYLYLIDKLPTVILYMFSHVLHRHTFCVNMYASKLQVELLWGLISQNYHCGNIPQTLWGMFTAMIKGKPNGGGGAIVSSNFNKSSSWLVSGKFPGVLCRMNQKSKIFWSGCHPKSYLKMHQKQCTRA